MKMLGLNLPRLNRLSYFLTVLVSAFVFVGAGLILNSIVSAILGPFDSSEPSSPYPVVLLPFMAAWFVYFATSTVKRLHDLNQTGWLIIAVFVPYINFIALLILIFSSGTDGKNKYGSKPTGVSILGQKMDKRK